MDDSTKTLEQALRSMEEGADAVVKALGGAVREAKKAKAAAKGGHLRDLSRALEAARQTAAAAARSAEQLAGSWTFDDRSYLETGEFARELQAEAERSGLTMIEQDGRLLTYPSVVKVLPGDAAVEIDRRRERRLRPKVLVERLRAAQQKQPRFKAPQFVESLRTAYSLITARDGKREGATVKLTDIYDVLTLMPGTARDYGKQEFARDILLLDRSGVTATRDGSKLSLPAATGTRTTATLSTVTPDGQLKVYYGIAFDR